MNDCVFCELWRNPEKRPADWWVYPHEGVARFTPLNPVVPGHVLFIGQEHFADVGVHPEQSSRLMLVAASYVWGLDAANVITSKGAAATQTVMHTHVHVVPRKNGDGLHLPWTGQEKS